jgi:hypothetical protein
MKSQQILWMSVTVLLIVISVGITRSLSRRAGSELGKLEIFTEQDQSGKGKLIGIRDKTTREALWTEYVGADGGIDVLTSFYEGKPVFEMHLRSIDNPSRGFNARRGLMYYGDDGKQKLLLSDRRGDGLFTDRVIYGEGEPRMEVWYQSQWMPLESRDGHRGLVLDGNWRRITFTNGAWTPRTE